VAVQGSGNAVPAAIISLSEARRLLPQPRRVEPSAGAIAVSEHTAPDGSRRIRLLYLGPRRVNSPLLLSRGSPEKCVLDQRGLVPRGAEQSVTPLLTRNRVGMDAPGLGELQAGYAGTRSAPGSTGSGSTFSELCPISGRINLFRLSMGHVYLTCPIIPSRSLLDAMACGSVIVASTTGPVMEVIQDGESGF
jgi:hypothetical protein